MYEPEMTRLKPGLYLVATPIGTAKDITLRALDVLNSVDSIAAEDTRTARKLMDIHGIGQRGRALIAYHDHTGKKARPELLRRVAAGEAVAYMSEAGTPLIADPGYHLVTEMREAGLSVFSVPGPSAVVTALSVGGLPTDSFTFIGFPPSTQKARQKFLSRYAQNEGTLVIYESPKRLLKSLEDMVAVFGSDRRATICRELTKKFEETISGALSDLVETLENRSLKGEIVVLIDRAPDLAPSLDPADELRQALKTHKTKEAATLVAEKLGLPRRDLYQMALELTKMDKDT